MNSFSNKSNNKLRAFFLSKNTDRFIFVLLLAIVFTGGLCESLLTLSYKYIPSKAGERFYVDYNWAFVVVAVIILFYAIREHFEGRKLPFDMTFLVLAQTMILVAVIDYHNEQYSTLAYAWILPASYLVGKMAVGFDKMEADRRIEMVVYVFMVGLFILSMLDFWNLGKYAFCWTESWPGFFTGEDQNRCGMAMALFLVNTSIVYIWMKRNNNPIWYCIVELMLVLSLCWSFKVESRTITLLPFLTIALVAMISLYDKRKRISNIVWITCGVFFLFTILLIYIVYSFNLGDIKTAYRESSWGAGIFENDRFKMDIAGFKLMLQNPYGRLEPPANPLDSPHNTFLQYGRVYGMAIFVLVEVFRLLTIKDAVVMTVDNSASKIKYLLIPAFICINMNFSLDPNGYIQRDLYMFILFISGLISGWNDVQRYPSQRFISTI